MALRIGDIAPDFEQLSTQGLLRFHPWKGRSWAVLFSHPHDFTPVCTTELGEAARLAPDFAASGAKLLGLSVDEPENHASWLADIDPRHVVRLILAYPNAVGRNFGEIRRALDALILTDAHPVVTPVNWRPGENVIAAPHLDADDQANRFGADIADLPYLCRVAAPALADR